MRRPFLGWSMSKSKHRKWYDDEYKLEDEKKNKSERRKLKKMKNDFKSKSFEYREEE